MFHIHEGAHRCVHSCEGWNLALSVFFRSVELGVHCQLIHWQACSGESLPSTFCDYSYVSLHTRFLGRDPNSRPHSCITNSFYEFWHQVIHIRMACDIELIFHLDYFLHTEKVSADLQCVSLPLHPSVFNMNGNTWCGLRLSVHSKEVKMHSLSCQDWVVTGNYRPGWWSTPVGPLMPSDHCPWPQIVIISAVSINTKMRGLC